MREEVLDGHLVADQRQIGTEDGAGRSRELEQPVFDEPDHDERCQPLRPAGERELRPQLVRGLVAPMSKPIRPRHDDSVLEVVNAHHA